MPNTNEQKKHIDQLHFEHKLWASAAKLCADQLDIFQERLEEIAKKNTLPDIRQNIAHFQNQFIIQREQLDILNHQINKHEQSLVNYAQMHPVAIDHVLFFDHTALYNQYETFYKLFTQLKTEFTGFLEQRL